MLNKTQSTPPSPISIAAEAGSAKKSNAAERSALNRDLADKSVGRPDATKSDYNVSLSSKGKELKESYAKAEKIAKDTPEVREAKVRDIKERIKNNTYKVDSEKIADGILHEAIKDYIAAHPQIAEDFIAGSME
ncbi:MAG: flagellar biosynthesis anti-sigma factor FlgM [Oligoflexales bacterium]|nr:flagellar biosynthesis anti-sigma factor FlgM [Oligoflexales bacterium]